MYVLSSALIFSALYVWCQINKDVIVQFWFGVQVKVDGWSGSQLMGIIAGSYSLSFTGHVLSMGSFLLFLHPWRPVSSVEHTNIRSNNHLLIVPPLSLCKVAGHSAGYCNRPPLLLPHHEVSSGVWRKETDLNTSVLVSTYTCIGTHASFCACTMPPTCTHIVVLVP